VTKLRAAVPTLHAVATTASLARISDRALLLFGAAVVVAVVGYPVVSGIRAIDIEELRALATARNVAPIWNTFLAALLTIPASLLIGVPLAWLCTRTNLPFRGAIAAMVGTSFVMPMLFTAIAYVFLFGRNAGLVNVLFRHIVGGPIYDIYSFSGVVFIAVLQCYPLIFFTTASGLARMNPELEEAARVAGLSPFAVFLRITLGAVLPSIMAGVAFSIATALTMLSAPLILAVPVGIPFLTSEMFAAIVMNPNIARAVALSVPLVLMTMAALWMQALILRGEEARFATVSGKGLATTMTDLGRWRVPLLVLSFVPISLSLVFPFLTLLAAGLMKHWWRGFTVDNFGVANFVNLFQSSTALAAMKNSLVASSVTGALLALFGGALAVVLAGPATPLKRLMRALGMFPLGIAHVVAGVLVILAWYGWPFQLGGTMSLLLLGYVMVMLPYALKTCEAARGQIETSLADAARIVGCSPLTSWRLILFPLMRQGLFATFLIVSLFCIKEFPLTAMIYSAETVTLAVRIYQYFEGGNYEQCGAAAVILLAMTFAMLLIARRVFGVQANEIRV
jgi:iron(III) transport system permease protein